MRMVVFADATPQMGTGHVMRCLALLQATNAMDIDALLCTRVSVPWVRKRLLAEPVSFVERNTPVPHNESAPDLLIEARKYCPEWVLLDGYHFGLDCQKMLRAEGYKVLVIDDYGHLPEYSCDILLNQNIGAENLPYAGSIKRHLIGLRYALLRQEFVTERQNLSQKPSGRVKNILVSLGGGDFSHCIQQMASYLSAPSLAGCIVRIIPGAMPRDVVKQALQTSPASIEILGDDNDMPKLFSWADLCITAGGSTCWELCCLGIPFLTVAIADNQQSIVKYLAETGIAPQFSFETLCDVLDKPQATLITKLQGLVDGHGAQRVLEQLSAPSSFYAPGTNL